MVSPESILQIERIRSELLANDTKNVLDQTSDQLGQPGKRGLEEHQKTGRTNKFHPIMQHNISYRTLSVYSFDVSRAPGD